MEEKIKGIMVSAGELLLEGFNKLQNYSVKERYHLQSEYDLRADEHIKKFINKEYPTYSIYSEETEEIRRSKNEKWIIDPIDGTTYFIFGEPFFSISMAREVNGKVVEAHVYSPVSKEYYYSDEVSKTSTLNGEVIKVSDTINIKDSLLAFGFSANPKVIKPYLENYSDVMENCKKALPWVGPALSICNVARGRVDGFVDYGCSYEGQAAASLILKNAGGRLRNIDKSEFDPVVKGGIFTNKNLGL